MKCPVLLLSGMLWVLSSQAIGAGEPAARSKGLRVAPDGRLLKDDRPYRGVGANYFDLLLRLLNDPANRSSLDGLQRLGKAGIPFVRFAVAYDTRQWKSFFQDRQEFFRRFDRVVQAAERAEVGLIPSFFWSFMSFPDLAGEPRDQWGNAQSRTITRMREAVGAIVDRYRDSPALWAWEFGNEPNLVADLPNAAQFRKPGGTERDDLTSRVMVVMLSEFAREVRRHDPHRPIIAGHSHPGRPPGTTRPRRAGNLTAAHRPWRSSAATTRPPSIRSPSTSTAIRRRAGNWPPGRAAMRSTCGLLAVWHAS